MSNTVVMEVIDIPAAPEKRPGNVTALRSRSGSGSYKGGDTTRQRLLRLRRAIIDGAYRIDPQRIASKMLRRR